MRTYGRRKAPEEQCSEAQAVSEKSLCGWQVPAPSWSENGVPMGDGRHKQFVRIRTKGGSQNGSHSYELRNGIHVGGQSWIDLESQGLRSLSHLCVSAPSLSLILPLFTSLVCVPTWPPIMLSHYLTNLSVPVPATDCQKSLSLVSDS